jgi:hypothetical protein
LRKPAGVACMETSSLQCREPSTHGHCSKQQQSTRESRHGAKRRRANKSEAKNLPDKLDAKRKFGWSYRAMAIMTARPMMQITPNMPLQCRATNEMSTRHSCRLDILALKSQKRRWMTRPRHARIPEQDTSSNESQRRHRTQCKPWAKQDSEQDESDQNGKRNAHQPT